MNGIVTIGVIEDTLDAIAKQYGIDPTSLREAHRPIIAALQDEHTRKLRAAEDEGFERGRMESELRHLYLTELGFGRIGRRADALDKVGVHFIIDSAIRVGGKFPGTLSLKQIRALQTELESCESTCEVVSLLEIHRSLICKSFGVGSAEFDACLADIKSLDSAASVDSEKALRRLNESLLLIAENRSKYEQG